MILNEQFLKEKGIDYKIENGGIIINGDLDLEDTLITSLGNLTEVGGNFWLMHTKIKSLGNLTEVGGSLYIQETPITSLGNLTCDRVVYNGEIDGFNFEIIDGICGVVISKKKIEDVVLFKCKTTSFLNGKNNGKEFYVAECGGVSAHGETIKEALDEYKIKISLKGDLSEYKEITLSCSKTVNDWATIYRAITGACKYGIKDFIERKKLNDPMTLKEVLEATKGEYGSNTFMDFFEKK